MPLIPPDEYDLPEDFEIIDSKGRPRQDDSKRWRDSDTPVDPIYDKNGRLRGSEQPIPGKCGRKLRKTDPPRYCIKDPVDGRDCCARHGGATPFGTAHWKFKVGKYSKHLPKNLRSAYNRAVNDEQLTSLKDDLALIHARQVQLLEELKRAKPIPWDQLLKAVYSLGQSLNDGEGVRESFEVVSSLVREGKTAADEHNRVWEEMGVHIDRKARVATAEHKRQQDLESTITAEQAMAMVQAFLAAGKEYIKDPSEYRLFTCRILNLVPEEKPDPIMIEAKEVEG